MKFVLQVEVHAPGTLAEQIVLTSCQERSDNNRLVSQVVGRFVVPEEVETWSCSVVERMHNALTEPLPF